MGPFDLVRSLFQPRRDLSELRGLAARLNRYSAEAEARRTELCRNVLLLAAPGEEVDIPIRVAVVQLIHALLAYEGHFYPPALNLNRPMTTTEVWELRAAAVRALVPFEQPNKAEAIGATLGQLVKSLTRELPPVTGMPGDASALSVPLS